MHDDGLYVNVVSRVQTRFVKRIHILSLVRADYITLYTLPADQKVSRMKQNKTVNILISIGPVPSKILTFHYNVDCPK